MLSPSLKSEDVQGVRGETTAILSRTTKLLPSDTVSWESHGFRERKKLKPAQKTAFCTSDHFAHPLPIHHPVIYFTESHGVRG